MHWGAFHAPSRDASKAVNADGKEGETGGFGDSGGLTEVDDVDSYSSSPSFFRP
jgi:hypothetical protein